MKDKLSIIVVFGSKIIVALLGVVLLSMQTKYITPADLGEYSLISGIVSAGVSFIVSWVGSSALRYYDANKKNLGKFNSTIFMGGVLSTVILLLMLPIVDRIAPNLYIRKYFLAVVLLCIAKCVYEIYEKILRASANFAIYSLLTIFQSVANLGLFYLMIQKSDSKTMVVFMSLIVSMAVFDVFAFAISKSYKDLKLKNVDPEMSKVFLAYGIPMVGTWAISWLLNSSDRYMINYFFSAEEVGLYTTAYTVAQNSIGIFTSSLTLTFFPILIKKWNSGGRAAATYYVNKILEYYLVFMTPAVVGLIMISKNIYGTVIDSSYINGLSVIAPTAIGFLFSGLKDILYKLWQLEERTKRILVLMTMAVTINIVANFLFLPIFGYVCAAYTTLASYLFIFLVAWIWIRKSFTIKINLKAALKNVVALIPMCVVLNVLQAQMTTTIGLLLCILVAAVVYMAIQLILGSFKEESKILYKYLRRDK